MEKLLNTPPPQLAQRPLLPDAPNLRPAHPCLSLSPFVPSPRAILGVQQGQATSQAVEEPLVPPAAPEEGGPLALSSHLLDFALFLLRF